MFWLRKNLNSEPDLSRNLNTWGCVTDYCIQCLCHLCSIIMGDCMSVCCSSKTWNMKILRQTRCTVWPWLVIHTSYQCCNEASKIFILLRFLDEDPSLSSSSVHFQQSKNLQSFEDFRPKIPKIFEIKSPFVEGILMEKWRKTVDSFDENWENFLMLKF